MDMNGPAVLLRIFIGEKDRSDGLPLYTAIVKAARSAGIAGATVLRGIEGYGASSLLHTARLLRLSEDLPIVIEIVDTERTVERFMPTLDALFERAKCGGMVTRETVQVIVYRSQR